MMDSTLHLTVRFVLIKVVKQRLQINTSYKGIFDCTASIYRQEGLGAFYLSFPTTLLMNIPFQVIQFTTYEYFRKKLNPSGSYNPLSHCIAGGIAGATAAIVSNPLDVAKTAIQTRGLSQDTTFRHISGLYSACKAIYTKHGLKGFGRGMKARTLSFIPSTAVAWTTVFFN
jgi:hypothetical protein